MLCWSFANMFRHDKFGIIISHRNTKETTYFDHLLDGIDIKDLFD